MKNSSQTQHRKSETKREEEQKIEEIERWKMQETGWRKHEENWQFRYDQIFAMIAKFLLPVFVFKRLRFGFSPFYPCNSLCFGLFF